MYSDFFLKLQDCLAPSESMISILLDTIETTQNEKENEIILTTYNKACVKFRELVRNEFTKPDGINAFDFFGEFKSIREYIAGCSESIVEPQNKDCFYSTKEDKFSIKIAKKGKLFTLQFEWFLLDVLNKGRTIFKLKPLPKEYWTHRIPE